MNRFLYLLLVSLMSFLANAQNPKSKTPERVINVNFNTEKGALNTMFNECVGAGRANEGLRADWQQQLA